MENNISNQYVPTVKMIEDKGALRITTLYKDIFTTVYVLKTEKGVLLFDAASFDYDADDYIMPALATVGITPEDIKYVFISHNHADHAGGLAGVMKHCPNAVILSRSGALKEKFSQYTVVCPEDGDVVLDVLQVVTIPGHSADSSAIFDTRTSTLISGDCLQAFGIFGSGKWASNITLTAEHYAALDKLDRMPIQGLLTAHDYHPYGWSADGAEAVKAYIDACRQALDTVKKLILDEKGLDDEAVCAAFESQGYPYLSPRVSAAMRAALADGKLK